MSDREARVKVVLDIDERTTAAAEGAEAMPGGEGSTQARAQGRSASERGRVAREQARTRQRARGETEAAAVAATGDAAAKGRRAREDARARRTRDETRSRPRERRNRERSQRGRGGQAAGAFAAGRAISGGFGRVAQAAAVVAAPVAVAAGAVAGFSEISPLIRGVLRRNQADVNRLATDVANALDTAAFNLGLVDSPIPEEATVAIVEPLQEALRGLEQRVDELFAAMESFAPAVKATSDLARAQVILEGGTVPEELLAFGTTYYEALRIQAEHRKGREKMHRAEFGEALTDVTETLWDQFRSSLD